MHQPQIAEILDDLGVVGDHPSGVELAGGIKTLIEEHLSNRPVRLIGFWTVTPVLVSIATIDCEGEKDIFSIPVSEIGNMRSPYPRDTEDLWKELWENHNEIAMNLGAAIPA